MTHKSSAMVAGLALLFLLATPVLGAERQMLPGHVPAAVARLNLQPLGRLPATNRLNLLIGLPLRNPAGLANLRAQLYDPRGTNFHRWLTPDQIARQFGPAEQDYQTVIAYAKANGLTVTTTHADHTLLRLQGAVADIEKMLHVTMRVYQHPTEARSFYAPDVEPTIDLSVPLLHISGLNNYRLPHPAGLKPAPANPAAMPAVGSGPRGWYMGVDFPNAYGVPLYSTYGVPIALTGSGQVLGLLELDGYYPNDITAYESAIGAFSWPNPPPNVTLQNVPLDGFDASGTPGANNSEVAGDIEMAIAMAPGLLEVVVYQAPNDGSSWIDIVKRMQEDNVAKQLSCSWIVEDDPNPDVIYILLGLQGQSFFQASGDNGAYYPDIGEWADDPNITIVGGTVLSTQGPLGLRVSETTWPGSGGGVSLNYWMGAVPIPSYQQGVSMSSNGGSTTMRNIPDVAMVSTGICVIYNNGFTNGLAGTSLSTPLWAGFTALVNQQAVANGQPTVGFLNPALYAIGQGPNYTNCLYNVATGNNINSHSPNAYFATNGYNLCTGWGSPNGINLINALMPYSGAIWVDFNYTGTVSIGSYDNPYKTLAQGVAGVPNNGNIWIKTAGSSPETMTIPNPMTIRAYSGAATIGH